MKLQIVLLAMTILASCSYGMKVPPKHGKRSGQSSTDSKSREDVQNVLEEDAANDLASLAKNTAGKSKGTKVPPGMYGMRKRVNGHGNHTPSPKPTPPPSTTSTPSTTLKSSTPPTPPTTATPSTTPMPTEAESDEGSGEVESVVTVVEVRFLAAEIAALIEDMDMPLEGLKSELVDQVSIIDNENDLSSFLKLTKEQFHLPMNQFGKMIRTAMNLVDRLYATGYELDGACLNLNKTVRAMIPESGEIPKNFHEKFLNAYLRSVSCVAQDNARFHKDIADLKELNEGSTRDQVMAAISKVMVGSIRLQRKISEQYSAVRFVRNLLPKAGLLSNIVQYKRLI